MRVGSTRTVMYLAGYSQLTGAKHVMVGMICTLVGWSVVGPSYFSQNFVLLFSFLIIYLFSELFCSICGVRAKPKKEHQNPHIRTYPCP